MHRLVLLAALALAACGQYAAWRDEVARHEETGSIFPRNYRAEILSLMRTYLNDPRQVRDAFVSEPQLRTIDGLRRYVVCLRYNPRKSGGQYTGMKENLVLFRLGRLDRIVDPVRDPRDNREVREVREHCKDMEMKPFPELEKLS